MDLGGGRGSFSVVVIVTAKHKKVLNTVEIYFTFRPAEDIIK